MEAPLLLLLLLLPMIIPVAFTTTTTTTAVAEGRLGVSQMVPLLVPSPLVGAIPAAGCALTMLMLRIPTVMGMIRRTPAAAARPLPPPTAAAAAAVPVPIAPTIILPSVSVVLSVSVVPPTAAAAAAAATVVVAPFPARRTRPTITMMPPIVASSSTAAGMMSSSSIDVSIAAVAASVPAVSVSSGADLEPAPAAGVGLPLPPPVAGPPLHVAVDPPGVRRGLVLPLPVLPPLLGGEPVEAQEGPASASVTSGVIATAGAGVGRGHESSPAVRAGRGRGRRLEASPDVLGKQAGQALAAAAVAAAISAVASAMVRHDCCLLPWVPTLLLFIDRLAGTRCAAVPRYPSWLLSVYALPPAARRLSVCRFVSLRWPVRPASGRPATDLLPAAHSTMACPWPMPPPPPP